MPFSGADPSTIRQLLLQHTFLPLISVQSTHNADALFQKECLNSLLSVLLVWKPYGNNAKYGVPNQAYKITNTLLITRTYGSFPVRFDPSLPELMTVHNSEAAPDKLRGLFSILSLDLLLKNAAQHQTAPPVRSEDNLYMNFFRKVITTNRIVLFDTLNHPVSQVFVIDFQTDSVDVLRLLIVEFRNFAFPKFFQIADLLIHVFVLFNSQEVKEADVAEFQARIRTDLSVTSTAVPMFQSTEQSFVKMSKFENATIDEEVQQISLQQSKEDDDDEYLKVPKSLDTTLRGKFHEYISKVLIPHMERKIRTWDDLILSPKKSITGRFFSVSRKLFNNNGQQAHTPSPSGTFNFQGNYYHRSSPEQAIRKLADWSLILKDFKYAYSTYDLIKKDYTNDKAWVYVASTQEMCIVSLLLAQTQPLASDTLPQPPDKNTLRKIRHDIIEPYIDNLSYTFKSRLNVPTYAIKTYLIVAELLLNMSIMFNIPWWWNDLIERYYLKCMGEFDSHLAASKSPQVIRAILYERLGYTSGRSFFVAGEYKRFVTQAFGESAEKKQEEVKEGHYENISKLSPDKDNSLKGLTRFRKSSLWYILAMRDWLQLQDTHQMQYLIKNIAVKYNIAGKNDVWYDRGDLVLGQIKDRLNEHS